MLCCLHHHKAAAVELLLLILLLLAPTPPPPPLVTLKLRIIFIKNYVSDTLQANLYEVLHSFIILNK
jgi:hypothetical protein